MRKLLLQLLQLLLSRWIKFWLTSENSAPINSNNISVESSSQLIASIKSHEGSQRFAYQDSLGYMTIGIGRCIDRRKGKGLSPDEQVYLLQNDINDCKSELEIFNWYNALDDVRKCVMIELVFNMGITGVLKFTNMIECINKKDFVCAASELNASKWATQVQKSRVDDLVYRLKNGSYK